uniref:Uncharacterized protein n=1 Tax=Romanomermis culicivorax TaxID=13658 RepID=A0A915JYF1_ROMCU
ILKKSRGSQLRSSRGQPVRKRYYEEDYENDAVLAGAEMIGAKLAGVELSKTEFLGNGLSYPKKPRVSNQAPGPGFIRET